MLRLDRHVPSPGVPEFNRRMGWLVAGVVLPFLLLGGRLWQLQVVRGDEYHESTTANFQAEQWIPAVRGKIKDRAGHVLVDNRPSFNLFVVPRHVTPEVASRLVVALALTEGQRETFHAKLARHAGSRARVLALEDIGRDTLGLFEQAKAELPGISVQDVPHRDYVQGTLAAHVLGYLNQITDAELESRRDEGYEEGDYIGRIGIERQWENYLRGKRGVERFVVDARGQRVMTPEAEALIAGTRFVPPAPGHTIVLTIDLALQKAAEKALEAYPAGGVAVIEVATGRVLALASVPPFDPNEMTGRLSRARLAQLEADVHKPFLDKTLRQHYYPGSTFKFVTILAALAAGVIRPDHRVICHGAHISGGRRFHCTKAHGSVSLVEALTRSCNVFVWDLAEKLGLDRIAEMATRFGFGVPSGLGMNGDVPGMVPTAAFYASRGGYRAGYALNTAIGQGDTTVTVVQLAIAFAALGNGGQLWVPQIVDRVETADGRVVTSYQPILRRDLGLRPEDLALVARGHAGTVSDPTGTAFAAHLEGVSVAGKTGTAQVKRLQKFGAGGAYDPERDHAWFAGYAPAEGAELAIAVVVEHGGKGGQVAAPVAMEIARAWKERAR